MRAALVIFLFALTAGAVLSCGPSDPPVCGPDNCSGCCDGDGNCVTFTNQVDTRCGAGGNACKSCPGTVQGFVCSERGTCIPGPDGEVTCGPDNCAGCCDGLQCVEYGAQTAAMCGASGTVCASCLGQQECRNGTCEQPQIDAGSCGAQGQSCCPGFSCSGGLQCQFGLCLAATSDAGTQTDAGVTGDAGISSDAGTQMDAGTVTDAGMTTPDAGTGGTLPIGEPCTQNGQCLSNQCRILGFPSGYCTQTCTSDAQCGAGATCGFDPSNSNARICLKTCPQGGSTGGCRPGYVCESRATPSTSSAAACVPGCTSPATCGSATTCDTRGFCCGANGYACCNGNSCEAGLGCDGDGYCKPMLGNIGAACTQNAQCQSNNCLPQQSGGAWSGGVCTQNCSASMQCPQGSRCADALSQDICLQSCSSPGGQSTCRSGYVCDKGWSGAGAVCMYACTAASQCGSNPGLGCSQGFCCGLSTYRCCGGNNGVGGTCASGVTCGPDGYCQ